MAFRADQSIAAALVLLLLLLLFNFITLPANAKAHSFGPPNTRSFRGHHHPPAATKIRPPPNTHSAVPPPPLATPWRYHVFLNFRGLDVRYTIADYLYYALVRKGIKAFRDDHDLPRGENITEAIPRAIEESRMSIVVLSKGYASSEWCLDELVKIMEAAKDNRVHHHQTFPIFYGVSPDEVSDQSSGCYKNDFDLHKRKFSYERVDNWRHALTSIADVSGWVLGPNDHRSEAEMVETIANDILLKIQQQARSTTEGESNQNERPVFVPAFQAPERAFNDETTATAGDEPASSSSPDDITVDQSYEEYEEAASKDVDDNHDRDSDNYKRKLWTSRSCTTNTCNNNNDHTHRDHDEGEQKLKYIKPIVSPEGKKTVRIPKVVAEEEVKRYWDLSLVAQQLSGRQNITIILTEANRLWNKISEANKEGITGVKEVATRKGSLSSYIFTFSNQDLRDWVVESSPWCIANATFVMRKWQPNVQLSDLLDRSTIPMWVRLVGIPMEYMTAKGLSYVASALGKPVYMDRATATRSRLAFAKVCVEMKLNKERFTSSIVVAIGDQDKNEEGGGEEEVVVQVVRVYYQWKPCMCIVNPSHKPTTTSTTTSSS